VRVSSAPKVYVINVATQAGETDHFSARDHIEVIDRQLGEGVLDTVLINSNPASAAAIGPGLGIEPVLPESLGRVDARIAVVARDVVSDQNPLRHDPAKLAAALLEIASEARRGDDGLSDLRRGNGNGIHTAELAAVGGSRE
jgi:uncharacterized cofD-like protein